MNKIEGLEIKNAIIKDTMLGYEDHGIFTCWIHLKFAGAGQGFGGICLGGEFTDKFIQGVLKTLKVNEWEKLAGTHVRVKATRNKVHEIGHFLEDSWFNPKSIEIEDGVK